MGYIKKISLRIKNFKELKTNEKENINKVIVINVSGCSYLNRVSNCIGIKSING